jgi:hypothetical protein
MLAVVWSSQGFYVVDVVPKGEMFDIDYDAEDVFSEILRACPVCLSHRLIIQADNARRHLLK